MGNRQIRRKAFADLLERQNVTAYALSKALWYRPQTVYNWIYGHGSPNPEAMLKIAEILGVSAEEILKAFCN